MPIDEAIEKLQQIRRSHEADDVQLWTTDADGEACRVSEFEVIYGDHVVTVEIS